MSDEAVMDDASHYEVSLTAGQAFVAFVLLLLSLAASFAFGLMIGKGQMDDRLVVRRTPSVVNEASAIPTRRGEGRIVEASDPQPARRAARVEESSLEEVQAPASELEPDPASQARTNDAKTPETVRPATSAAAIEKAPASRPAPAIPAVKPSIPSPGPAAETKPLTPVHPAAVGAPVVHYAQVLSTADVKTAESLAAKLIDSGFTAAYVERTLSIRGMVYRVRVRFASEPEARGSVDKLRSITGSDVWITK